MGTSPRKSSSISHKNAKRIKEMTFPRFAWHHKSAVYITRDEVMYICISVCPDHSFCQWKGSACGTGSTAAGFAKVQTWILKVSSFRKELPCEHLERVSCGISTELVCSVLCLILTDRMEFIWSKEQSVFALQRANSATFQPSLILGFIGKVLFLYYFELCFSCNS